MDAPALAFFTRKEWECRRIRRKHVPSIRKAVTEDSSLLVPTCGNYTDPRIAHCLPGCVPGTVSSYMH